MSVGVHGYTLGQRRLRFGDDARSVNAVPTKDIFWFVVGNVGSGHSQDPNAATRAISPLSAEVLFDAVAEELTGATIA